MFGDKMRILPVEMINKEVCDMTRLDCTVSTCVHYAEKCCCKSGIFVEGAEAKSGRDTYCGSFEENKGNFFSELKTKGLFMKIGTVEGKTVKNTVRGYIIDTDFVEIDSSVSIPFT